jgi:hypothetical protein
MVRFATSIAVVSVVACSGDDPAPFDCTLLPVCDIRGAPCQNEVFLASACAREQQGASAPPVRTISRQELEAELRRDLAENPEGIPGAWEAAYQLLGLIPSRPLGDVLVESAVSNIAAFYRTDTKQVTVIQDNALGWETGAWILSHEYVHALQDQAVDLTAFEQQWTRSTDDSMALTSLIEGEAMLHPNVLQVRRRGGQPARFGWDSYASRLLTSVLETLEAAPAPFIDAVSLLPYPVGFRFVIDPWLGGGQGAIDGLFEQPRFPFLSWLSAVDGGDPGPIEPLTCFPTGAPSGYTGFDHDRMGPTALLGLHVGQGTLASAALRVSTTLHDDSLVVFTNAPDAAREGVAVAWRLRFRDAGAAATFENSIGPALRAPAFSLQRFDREVLIRTAGDPAVLEAWTNAAECGHAEDLPVRSSTSQAMSALIRQTLHGKTRARAASH